MTFGELAKEITERRAHIKRGNVNLSMSDFMDLIKQSQSLQLYTNELIQEKTEQFEFVFMGVPIIIVAGKIMAWIECEFCHTQELPNKEYGCCSRCGVPL